MKKNIISLASLAVMLSLGQAEAQETQAKSGTDTLAPMVKEVQADLKKLKKIKPADTQNRRWTSLLEEKR